MKIEHQFYGKWWRGRRTITAGRWQAGVTTDVFSLSLGIHYIPSSKMRGLKPCLGGIQIDIPFVSFEFSHIERWVIEWRDIKTP